MARAETGSCVLSYPETNEGLVPASAKWQLVADWSGDSRPAELTLTVESDMNAAIIGYEYPVDEGGYSEGWIDLRGYTFFGTLDWDLIRESITIRSQFVTPEIEYEIVGPPTAQGVDVFGVGDGYTAERVVQIRALNASPAGDLPRWAMLRTHLTLSEPDGGWPDGPPITGIGEGEHGVVLGRGALNDDGDLVIAEIGLGGGREPVSLAPVPIWRGPLWPGFLAAGHAGSTVFVAGAPHAWLESPNAGAARISYSRAGVGRTLIVDLRSTRLYLGNCDQVRVEVLRYRTREEADRPDTPQLIRDRASWKIGAHVGVAQGGVYDEPVCTTIGTFLGPDRVTVYAPPHAIAFEPFAAPPIPLVPSESVETVHEADDPPLRYVQDQGQSAIFTPRDGRVLPARRVPLTSARVSIVPLSPLPRRLWLGMRWILST